MPLTEVKSNREYKVTQVLDGDLKRRLLDMGFVPGSKLKVVCKAPFGGTILICLRGFNIALRENATDFIMVEAV